MFDDLTITITATEPPASGANVTLLYAGTTEVGTFSLTALATQVAVLTTALHQGHPMTTALRNAGAEMFGALFSGPLFRTYTKASALAKARGHTLRLQINTQIPALVAVAWEYLYDRDLERWLALDGQLSLVRSLPVAGSDPLPVQGNLRVLVMIAAPSDLPALDSEHEWRNLQTVAASAAIELIRIDPTYAALQAALRQAPHVFHFIGHGALPSANEAGRPATPQRHFSTVPNPVRDAAQQEGRLALCDQHGQSVAMPASSLATLLGNCQSLRLALLNTCQGATPGAASAFAGVAQKLIQQGTPAVIAMQAPIGDDHAIRFSQEFYRALADGYGVEAAVGEGRKRINEVAATWGIPTLYFQGSEPFAINDRRGASPTTSAALPSTPAQPEAAQATHLPDVVNPYRGLEYFDVHHAENYFGRAGMVEKLLSKLQATHFVAVVGASGSGKSSLVRAGLVTALQAGQLPGSRAWQVEIIRPGDDPLRALSTPLVNRMGGALTPVDRIKEVRKMAAGLQEGTLPIGDVLAEVRSLQPGMPHLLLIFAMIRHRLRTIECGTTSYDHPRHWQLCRLVHLGKSLHRLPQGGQGQARARFFLFVPCLLAFSIRRSAPHFPEHQPTRRLRNQTPLWLRRKSG